MSAEEQKSIWERALKVQQFYHLRPTDILDMTLAQFEDFEAAMPSEEGK